MTKHKVKSMEQRGSCHRFFNKCTLGCQIKASPRA